MNRLKFNKRNRPYYYTKGEVKNDANYDGVCKTLHKKYYESDYNGKNKLLFGSYKTKTNTCPIDLDPFKLSHFITLKPL
ncbi:MAG: hypothetical protein K9J25_01065 [Bacteroidales bacterium]|nr:hypothetical protein [Bacteroidales bacterium]